jgi:uncharacterized membrane protein (UPF0127 family)
LHLPVAVHRHPRARRALRHVLLLERLAVAHSRQRVRNRTRNTVLASDCRIADSFLSRGLGLIPRASLGPGEGLLITKTSLITMWFMRFAIDAVFIDRAGRVVRVAERLAPWRFGVGARGARDVLELPAGAAGATGTQAGDELVFEPA